MDKKKETKIFKALAVVVLAAAVGAAIAGCVTNNFQWFITVGFALSCTTLLRVVIDCNEQVNHMAESSKYKDGIIGGLYEQRNKLYEQIARLTDECEELKRLARVESEKTAEDVSLSSDERVDLSLETNNIAHDDREIDITVTSDKAMPLMDSNLYIQPKDEFSRWWKIRGYDTDLSNPDKEYYIYIRLAHKGFDGELHFLSKSRLIQNEVHRFIQVGTISPVVDGVRTVSYSIDGFRFKRIKKGKR